MQRRRQPLRLDAEERVRRSETLAPSFREFLDTVCMARDYFSAVLARTSLFRSRAPARKASRSPSSPPAPSNALGISRDAEDAIRLFDSCLEGHKCSAYARACDFALFAAEGRKKNALEMKWIIMIIVKAKGHFSMDYHDAEDLFNVACDPKFVCKKLRDCGLRHKRQDFSGSNTIWTGLLDIISNIL
ncbi:DNA ligase 4-like isoform X2 [Syzygium oleosum]|uniref:DNA ligase 4-like isoform X2 n=1 Tax=Syzygium oleosum TaxID=219896 RepID=UPI0011D1B327|nr:DNA ligase 4-like isoform X2 [Syzygium oleosum]